MALYARRCFVVRAARYFEHSKKPTDSLDHSACSVPPGLRSSPLSKEERMAERGVRESIRRIAMLGNHLPRQCGIATFTADLSAAIAEVSSQLDCFVLAMNDVGRQHLYPPRVQFEISEPDLVS